MQCAISLWHAGSVGLHPSYDWVLATLRAFQVTKSISPGNYKPSNSIVSFRLVSTLRRGSAYDGQAR